MERNVIMEVTRDGSMSGLRWASTQGKKKKIIIIPAHPIPIKNPSLVFISFRVLIKLESFRESFRNGL